VNGITALFTLVGMIVVGLFFSLILCPLVLLGLEKTVYILAWLTAQLIKKTIKKPPIFTNTPINQRKNGKTNIQIPYSVHHDGNFVINEYEVGQIPNIHNFCEADCPRSYQNTFDMTEQPIARKFDKVLNILHGLIGFYLRFYGKSTKSKQNLIKIATPDPRSLFKM
jgi:hypothetical protein